MSTQESSSATWIKYLAIIVVATIVSSALTYLAINQIGYTVSLNKDGTVTITVRPNDSFPVILEKAIAENPKLVRATLASEDYYNLTDVRLVSALERLDYSEKGNKEIASGFRMMLYDLRGPFKVPGALRDAKSDTFVAALDDLEEALENDRIANAILAELWRRHQNQQSIFKLRHYKGTAEIVPNAPFGDEAHPLVFTCPGSALPEGRIIQLKGVAPNHGQTLAQVHQNPVLFPCDSNPLTVEELLSKKPVRLGLSEAAFNRLLTVDTTDRKVDVTFLLYGKNQMPLIIIGPGT